MNEQSKIQQQLGVYSRARYAIKLLHSGAADDITVAPDEYHIYTKDALINSAPHLETSIEAIDAPWWVILDEETVIPIRFVKDIVEALNARDEQIKKDILK